MLPREGRGKVVISPPGSPGFLLALDVGGENLVPRSPDTLRLEYC